MWNWVRPSKTANPGADDTRLRILRDLASVDASEKALVAECHKLVVDTLLAYSKGKQEEEAEAEEKKKAKIMPYGNAASFDTPSFQKVPFAWMASTLATVYPFVASEKPGESIYNSITYYQHITPYHIVLTYYQNITSSYTS